MGLDSSRSRRNSRRILFVDLLSDSATRNGAMNESIVCVNRPVLVGRLRSFDRFLDSRTSLPSGFASARLGSRGMTPTRSVAPYVPRFITCPILTDGPGTTISGARMALTV